VADVAGWSSSTSTVCGGGNCCCRPTASVSVHTAFRGGSKADTLRILAPVAAVMPGASFHRALEAAMSAVVGSAARKAGPGKGAGLPHASRSPTLFEAEMGGCCCRAYSGKAVLQIGGALSPETVSVSRSLRGNWNGREETHVDVTSSQQIAWAKYASVAGPCACSRARIPVNPAEGNCCDLSRHDAITVGLRGGATGSFSLGSAAAGHVINAVVQAGQAPEAVKELLRRGIAARQASGVGGGGGGVSSLPASLPSSFPRTATGSPSEVEMLEGCTVLCCAKASMRVTNDNVVLVEEGVPSACLPCMRESGGEGGEGGGDAPARRESWGSSLCADCDLLFAPARRGPGLSSRCQCGSDPPSFSPFPPPPLAQLARPSTPLSCPSTP
jgi:hypothetical protein